jgi:Tfp pilus assembly protein PilW
MIINYSQINRLVSSAGISVMDVLVATMISSIVILAGTSTFVLGTRNYHDVRTKAEVDENANLVLNLMANDIKLAGNGLPNNSGWNGPTTTHAVPLVAGQATSTQIVIRTSKGGKSTVLKSALTPVTTGFSMTVLESIFAAGDRIYVNGTPVGKNFGLTGYINSVSGDTLTIAGNAQAATTPAFTASAVFPVGSTVQKIPFVGYRTTDYTAGINYGESNISAADISWQVMVPNTRFTLEYFNQAMTTQVAVATDANIMSSLAAVRITVYARGAKPLTNGATYEAWAQKTVGINFMTVNRAQAWN